jgi:hypothetical protein
MHLGLTRGRLATRERMGREPALPRPVAARLTQLRRRERDGEIEHLTLEPSWDVTLAFGRYCTFTAAFAYIEGGRIVIEDVQPAEGPRDLVHLEHRRAAVLAHNITITEVRL